MRCASWDGWWSKQMASFRFQVTSTSLLRLIFVNDRSVISSSVKLNCIYAFCQIDINLISSRITPSKHQPSWWIRFDSPKASPLHLVWNFLITYSCSDRQPYSPAQRLYLVWTRFQQKSQPGKLDLLTNLRMLRQVHSNSIFQKIQHFKLHSPIGPNTPNHIQESSEEGSFPSEAIANSIYFVPGGKGYWKWYISTS